MPVTPTPGWSPAAGLPGAPNYSVDPGIATPGDHAHVDPLPGKIELGSSGAHDVPSPYLVGPSAEAPYEVPVSNGGEE